MRVMQLSIEELSEISFITETLRFSNLVWLPRMDPVLRKCLIKHEDFFHKLKRITANIRAQKVQHAKGSGNAGPKISDRDILIGVAKKSHEFFLIK